MATHRRLPPSACSRAEHASSALTRVPAVHGANLVRRRLVPRDVGALEGGDGSAGRRAAAAAVAASGDGMRVCRCLAKRKMTGRSQVTGRETKLCRVRCTEYFIPSKVSILVLVVDGYCIRRSYQTRRVLSLIGGFGAADGDFPASRCLRPSDEPPVFHPSAHRVSARALGPSPRARRAMRASSLAASSSFVVLFLAIRTGSSAPAAVGRQAGASPSYAYGRLASPSTDRLSSGQNSRFTPNDVRELRALQTERARVNAQRVAQRRSPHVGSDQIGGVRSPGGDNPRRPAREGGGGASPMTDGRGRWGAHPAGQWVRAPAGRGGAGTSRRVGRPDTNPNLARPGGAGPGWHRVPDGAVGVRRRDGSWTPAGPGPGFNKRADATRLLDVDGDGSRRGRPRGGGDGGGSPTGGVRGQGRTTLPGSPSPDEKGWDPRRPLRTLPSIGNSTALQAACKRRPPAGMWTLLEEILPKNILRALVPSGEDGLFGRPYGGAKGNDGDDRTPKMDLATCAVVGNSGVLLMSEYGEAIDAHTFVLRMNIAPSVGPVRRHAGKRTHARVFNNKWTKAVAAGERLPIKVEPGAAVLLRTTDTRLVERAQKQFYASDDGGKGSATKRAGSVLQFNYGAVEAARVALGAYKACLRVRRKPVGQGGDLPSAGFAAAFALSRMCGKVRLFGFGSPPPGATVASSVSGGKRQPVGYQYFAERLQDGSLNAGSPSHNFDLEFMALQSLARNVKSVTMCGPGGEGQADCKAPPKPPPAKSKEEEHDGAGGGEDDERGVERQGG